MKEKRVYKYFQKYFKSPSIILSLAVLLLFSLNLDSAQLTNKSLQNDLNYYYNVSKQKQLSVNDKKYILQKIEEKYRGSTLDLAPLQKEFEKLYKPEVSSSPIQPAEPQKNDSPAGGSVYKLLITESSTDSRITIKAAGVKRTNSFLLRDPDPSVAPKIVLDLYGVKNNLVKKARDITLKNSLFARVQAAQFEDKPEEIVRIVAELKKDLPYKITQSGDGWLITAAKEISAATPVQTKQIEPVSVKPAKVSAPVTAPAAEASKPKENIAVNYHIEPGDVLAVSVYPADELSRDVTVQPDGKIPFKLIGTAEAKSLTPEQLGRSISSELGKYLSNPQVNISVKQFSRRQIFVTGEVKGSGAYNFKDNLRLMEFISSVGGFTENADRRAVKIYRGPPTKRQTHIANVEAIVSSGDFSKDFLLEPGDIIEVSKGQVRISVLGEARSPGYYDFKDNMKLLELISLAGGFTESALITKVTIIRPDNQNGQKVIKINLSRTLEGMDKDTVIQPGDTIYIPKKNLASANTFLTNILPWLSLVSLVLVIRTGI